MGPGGGGGRGGVVRLSKNNEMCRRREGWRFRG